MNDILYLTVLKPLNTKVKPLTVQTSHIPVSAPVIEPDTAFTETQDVNRAEHSSIYLHQ